MQEVVLLNVLFSNRVYKLYKKLYLQFLVNTILSDYYPMNKSEMVNFYVADKFISIQFEHWEDTAFIGLTAMFFLFKSSCTFLSAKLLFV